jgi:hypothetical protein
LYKRKFDVHIIRLFAAITNNKAKEEEEEEEKQHSQFFFSKTKRSFDNRNP